MSPKSHLTLDLQVEDFQRLGVRPDEMRLTVIRRAATQSSRTLAESQLTEPSDTAALQLSRVTTSAYRLLDPRKRGDAHQRIHVGRILPTVLMWAGQTKFQNQPAGAHKNSMSRTAISGAMGANGADASMPFQGGGLSEADLIELMELDSTPLLAGQPTWAQSLSDNDILRRTPLLKRWNRWKRVLVNRWYAIGLGVVLIVLFLGALAFPSGDKPSIIEEADTATSIDSGALDLGKVQSASMNRLASPTAKLDKAVGRDQGLELIDKSEVVLTDTSELDAQFLNPIVSVDTIPDTIFELENPVANLAASTTSSEKSDDMDSAAGSELSDSDTSDFLPDPFASPASTSVPESLDSESNSVSSSDSVASRSVLEQAEMTARPEIDPTSGKVPEGVSEQMKRVVPDRDAVADAREYFLSLDSISMVSGDADKLAQRLVALRVVKEPLRLASSEYWAVSILLMESVWQTRGTSDVKRILIDLQQHYEFASAPLLVETYLAANVRSALPEIQQDLLANGLVLLDQLVTAEEFERAKQILSAVEALASTLQDADATKYLLGYERAIVQAIRQRERFESLLINSPDPKTWSQSNRGVLGRYYCLVLHHWSDGLPWLCSASDPRVASVAKSELTLAGNPSVKELVAIARRWNLNAVRASGLTGYAMRLHAVSLFRKAMETASESQRLKLGTELREISETLPSHMRNADFKMVNAKD